MMTPTNKIVSFGCVDSAKFPDSLLHLQRKCILILTELTKSMVKQLTCSPLSWLAFITVELHYIGLPEQVIHECNIFCIKLGFSGESFFMFNTHCSAAALLFGMYKELSYTGKQTL